MADMVARAVAKQEFDRLRAERDQHAANGDDVRAWQAHEAANQVMDDYRSGKK